MSVTTLSTAETARVEIALFTVGEWRGHRVTVETDYHDRDRMAQCAANGHQLEQMENYGLPTPHLYCHWCFGMADIPAGIWNGKWL